MFRSVRPFASFVVAIIVLTSVGVASGKPLPERSAQAQPADRIVELGQVGGRSQAIAVRGNQAYLGIGPRLYALDITDRANPRSMARTGDLGVLISDIVLDGSYAYVAAETKGLLIYDIGDPARLMLVGSYDTPGRALDLAIVNGLAYIADHDGGLRILDVAQPARPVEIGVLTVPHTVSGVTVANGLVFVVNAAEGLKIFDASDPIRLTQLGKVGLGNGFDVAVVDDYAYVADTYGLRTIDISDPTDPEETDMFYTDFMSLEVAVASGFVYITDMSDRGLRVFDRTDPAHPVLAKEVSTRGGGTNVAVDGSYVYLVEDTLGLTIFDASDPRNPSQVGRYVDVGGVSNDFPGASNIVESAGFAYLNIQGRRLSIVDVRDPVNPTEVGSLDIDCCIRNHIVDGQYVYVRTRFGVRIIDVGDPTKPREVGSYTNDSITVGVAVQGNYMYAADYNGSLRIVDIADRTQPTEVANLAFGFYKPLQVLVNQQYAYVIADSHVLIVDISNKTRPVNIENSLSLLSINDVALQGTFLYAAMNEGLDIIDVANPSNPSRVGSYFADDIYGRGITIQGTTAYLASDDGLHVLDVSNPTAPRVLHEHLTDSYTDVAVNRNIIYATNRDRGLNILRVPGDVWVYLPLVLR